MLSYYRRVIRAALTLESPTTIALGGLITLVGAALSIWGDRINVGAEDAQYIGNWMVIGGIGVAVIVRLLLAPMHLDRASTAEADELRGKLNDLEERRPRFVIRNRGRNGFLPATYGGEPVTAVIVPLEVTNIGFPGAASQWSITLYDAEGDIETTMARTHGTDSLIGEGIPEIPHDELITERTSRIVAAGETRSGWLCAVMKDETRLRGMPNGAMAPGLGMRITCEDALGRPTEKVLEMARMGSGGEFKSRLPGVTSITGYAGDPPPAETKDL